MHDPVPLPPEKVGLNVLAVLHDRYRCPVGLSDHSGTIFPGLAAVTLGARVLEIHVTMSREMFGPDVASSITSSELAELIRGVRFTEQMLANPVDKDQAAEELGSLRSLFTKSVVVRSDLPAGTVLSEQHLTVKKPGTGIPANKLPELLGRRTARPLTRDHLLQESDLEGVP